MGWQSEEFGSYHEGRAGAVLADGSEPKPVYLDAGSGGGPPPTSDWRVCDGRFGAPKAAALRGSCSCGWRGTPRYPIDWPQVIDDGHSMDTSGPRGDWEQHISEVRARSVPLPVGLEELLERVEEHLDALAVEAPVAALKAVAALERITGRIGHRAAHHAQADEQAGELSWEAIGTALGLSEADARSRLIRYSFRRRPGA
ncbi:hypothetical protein ACFY41_07270 [Streptomyces syringium]|uniref:hypothetical protein n=1 Tax=Streptomyces syringium TaxID=76729 RepID=UPI0036B32CEC